MDIPIKALVTCNGEECGKTVCVIMNPCSNELTHVVVEDNAFPYQKRIVPVDLVKSSTPKLIQLSCTKDEFLALDDFIEHHYIPAEQTYGVFPVNLKVYIPYSEYSNDLADIARERVPEGGIAFHPGTLIEATDGKVGQVDEFLIDPASEHITHLVMKEGHLWHTKEIAIPASEIDRVENDVVRLKISKAQIESLPSMETLMEKNPG